MKWIRKVASSKGNREGVLFVKGEARAKQFDFPSTVPPTYTCKYCTISNVSDAENIPQCKYCNPQLFNEKEGVEHEPGFTDRYKKKETTGNARLPLHLPKDGVLLGGKMAPKHDFLRSKGTKFRSCALKERVRAVLCICSVLVIGRELRFENINKWRNEETKLQAYESAQYKSRREARHESG